MVLFILINYNDDADDEKVSYNVNIDILLISRYWSSLDIQMLK